MSEEFTRCDRCQRTSGLHEEGTKCVRGYKNPHGHEVPRCQGTMVPNRPLEFAPAPQLAHLKHTQTFRLYKKAYERMGRGDGYLPCGFDWPTIRLTKPGWYRALKLIIATNNEAARKFREANHKPQSSRMRRQAEFHGRGSFEKHWPVHMRVPPSQDGCHTAHPLCYNGAHNIRWSAKPEEVNCPACKAAMVLRAVNMLRLTEKRTTIFEHVNGLLPSSSAR